MQVCCLILLLYALQLQSLNVLVFSTYNFQLLRCWMQLVQIFIFSFFMSFLMSSFHLFFGLPNVIFNIGFHLLRIYFFNHSPFDIRCKWPNQLNLCVFMQFIKFLCRINLSNSSNSPCTISFFCRTKDKYVVTTEIVYVSKPFIPSSVKSTTASSVSFLYRASNPHSRSGTWHLNRPQVPVV